MQQTATIQCPYCFESVDIWVDPTDEGTMYRDCDVCCNPWELEVRRRGDRDVQVQVRRAS